MLATFIGKHDTSVSRPCTYRNGMYVLSASRHLTKGSGTLFLLYQPNNILTSKKYLQMTDVKIFNSPMFGELRVTRNEKRELLFCLKDVCDSLGLQVKDVAKRIVCNPDSVGVSSEVKQHPCLDIITVGVQTGTKADGTPAIQQTKMYFVTEPDLYRCIFQSRKPTARKFQDWVFNECCPRFAQQAHTL